MAVLKLPVVLLDSAKSPAAKLVVFPPAPYDPRKAFAPVIVTEPAKLALVPDNAPVSVLAPAKV
jgi:hypothetical protein